LLKIKLATGREMECDYMDHSEIHRQANIRIVNTSVAEIAAIFSNPVETAAMWFEKDYAAGFTKLLAMIDDGDAIRVVMGKE
jgi:hypothetical protein